MKPPGINLINEWKQQKLFVNKRWPWHVLFWIGYIIFRFWLYYITVKYYPQIFLEYMLLSEILFVATVYFTIFLYRRLFEKQRYAVYFLIGAASWVLYLCGRTAFQFYYLQHEPSFKGSSFIDIFLNNITVVILYFLFITSCKYFKDGYIAQQFESEKKEQQLLAEVNNLKSQIAPHFLFNTLNNLYGLSVEKSDKLPSLMLRLSDLLRHSLYETQKPLVPINEEINVLKSYIDLESIRLEDDLRLKFDDSLPVDAGHYIAPLILIVFVENAFKHARFVQGVAIEIYIKTRLDDDWFSLTIKNNYNKQKKNLASGIGLINVSRRLEILYPGQQHNLQIVQDEMFYTVTIKLKLVKAL